jgi:hypothetical protein
VAQLPNEAGGDKTPLGRHWPLAVSILSLTVMCFLYVAIYTTKSHSAITSLVLAILPELIASLAIAACLYLLLNRDIRAVRSEPGRGAQEIPSSLRNEIEAINAHVAALSEHGSLIRRRATLPRLDDFFDGSTTISIAAVSGLGLVNHFRGLLEQQLRQGKSLRVLLLDVEKRDALTTWDRLSNPPMIYPEDDIKSGVRQFTALARTPGLPGRCEVKLFDTIFPYSLIMCEKADKRGVIQVEMHAYRRAPEDRPNLLLSSEVHPHWYQFFSRQFNDAWDNSKAT